MAFVVHTLTGIGATMIASATAGNHLYIDGCALTNNQYSLSAAKQLNAVPADAPYTTNITVSSLNNVASARCTFLRNEGATTGGNWYSMILFGRMYTDAPGTQKPIAVLVSDSQFYIPETDSSISDVSVIFGLGMNISTSIIEVPVETIYALNSELSALRDVTVTTHNINDPSIGDIQTIKGIKRFQSEIRTNLGMGTEQTEVDGIDYIVRTGKFTPGSTDFEFDVAQVENVNDNEYYGLYINLDSTGETSVKCDTHHAFIPGLISDRTDYYYIGCITMIALYVGNVTPTDSHLDVGEDVTWIDDYCQLYAAKWSVSDQTFVKDTGAQLKNMKFRLMTSCDVVKLGTSIIMAMRVE